MQAARAVCSSIPSWLSSWPSLSGSANGRCALDARARCRTADAPFVSVIVVNYNGKHFLKRCLESLAAQTYPEDRREVILVDNGSSDGSAEYVASNFPWVRIVRASTNWGFAKGNNIGLQYARGDLIALLNNDAVAEPAWLSAMTRGLQRDPAIGGVTSKILFLRQPGVINSAGLDLYRDGRGGDRGFRQPDHGPVRRTDGGLWRMRGEHARAPGHD